jgi:hypothetical protein
MLPPETSAFMEDRLLPPRSIASILVLELMSMEVSLLPAHASFLIPARPLTSRDEMLFPLQ